MKSKIRNNLGLFIKLCFVFVLVIFLIILLILKTNVDICENWTRTFSRFYQSVLGPIFKYVPFSLTEWIFVSIVVSSAILLIISIVKLAKKKYKKSLILFTNMCLIVLTTLVVYQATAEMAYNRDSVPISLYNEKVEKDKFRTIIDYYVSDLNYCENQLKHNENGEIVNPYSNKEMNELMEQEYKRIEDPYFTSFTMYGKPMLSSFLYREFHITGVTFLPTTEANINYLNVNAGKPFTLAHEIAHTKGVMREDDANLVAAYLLLTSDNPYFRYSAYYYTISSLLSLADYTGNVDEYNDVISTINSGVKQDWSYCNKYWNEHNSMANFANWVNDTYLKLSGANKGVESYNDSPIIVDPTKKEITLFSTYQKLYFQLFFN